MDRELIIQRVSDLTAWWIGQRTAKILQVEHGSMEVNPFLAPLICALHGLHNSRELSDFVTAGHFYIGHGTGFGKLIDEKILPEAFGTEKLDKSYRKQKGLQHPAYDDIDHIVTKPDGRYLLSQKASKWTIQLGQAMGLNRSFKTLLDMRDQGLADFKKIVVGVFYGHNDDLTDKYRIIRGITTGAAHDVVDISNDVEVHAGRSFWNWLVDAPDAQEWVMSGIIRAIQNAKADEKEAQSATENIERELTGMLAQVGDIQTEGDWLRFINAVNR
jgi:hypothetical protein